MLHFILVSKNGMYVIPKFEGGSVSFEYRRIISSDICVSPAEIRSHRKELLDRKEAIKSVKIYAYKGEASAVSKKRIERQGSYLSVLLENEGAFEKFEGKYLPTLKDVTDSVNNREIADFGLGKRPSSQIEAIEKIADSDFEKVEKPEYSAPSEAVVQFLNGLDLKDLQKEERYENYILTEVCRVISDCTHFMVFDSFDNLDEETKSKTVALLENALRKRTDLKNRAARREVLRRLKVANDTEVKAKLSEILSAVDEQRYYPKTVTTMFEDGKPAEDPYIPEFTEWYDCVIMKNSRLDEKILQADEGYANFSEEAIKMLTKDDTEEKSIEGTNTDELRFRNTSILGRDIDDEKEIEERQVSTVPYVGHSQRTPLETYVDEDGIIHFAGSTKTAVESEFKALVQEVKNGALTLEAAAQKSGMNSSVFRYLYSTYTSEEAASKQQCLKVDKTIYRQFKMIVQEEGSTIKETINSLLSLHPEPEMLKFKRSDIPETKTVWLKPRLYKEFYENKNNEGKDLSLCLGQLVTDYVNHFTIDVPEHRNPVTAGEYASRHHEKCPVCGHDMCVAHTTNGNEILICSNKDCSVALYTATDGINFDEDDITCLLNEQFTSVYEVPERGIGRYQMVERPSGRILPTFMKIK